MCVYIHTQKDRQTEKGAPAGGQISVMADGEKKKSSPASGGCALGLTKEKRKKKELEVERVK